MSSAEKKQVGQAAGSSFTIAEREREGKRKIHFSLGFLPDFSLPTEKALFYSLAFFLMLSCVRHSYAKTSVQDASVWNGSWAAGPPRSTSEKLSFPRSAMLTLCLCEALVVVFSLVFLPCSIQCSSCSRVVLE